MTRHLQTSIAVESSARHIIRSNIAGCVSLAERPPSGAGAAPNSMRSTSSAAIGFPLAAGRSALTKSVPHLGEARALLGVAGVERCPARPAATASTPVERGTGGPLVELRSRFRSLHHRSWPTTCKMRPRCTLMIHATVREVMLADDKGSVERLDVRTPSGRKIDIRARHYLLAAGGIENPRILLASNSVVRQGDRQRLRPGRPLFHGASRMPVAVASSARPNGAGCRPSPSGGSMASRVSPAITPAESLQRREGLLNSAR